MTYSAKKRQASPGKLVQLFQLDARRLKDKNGNAGPQLFWVPGPATNNPVVFNKITYTPLPIEASGFEWTTKGTLPQPKITVSNVNAGLLNGVNFYTETLAHHRPREIDCTTHILSSLLFALLSQSSLPP